jgi:hypothetical protein
LKDTICNQNTHLESTPPFDAAVGALSSIPMDALAQDDVGLFVFDLNKKIGQRANLVK